MGAFSGTVSFTMGRVVSLSTIVLGQSGTLWARLTGPRAVREMARPQPFAPKLVDREGPQALPAVGFNARWSSVVGGTAPWLREPSVSVKPRPCGGRAPPSRIHGDTGTWALSLSVS